MSTNYATTAELQNAIDPQGGAWGAGDLTILELALGAASRWIDEHKGTRFYAVAETRHYTADYPDLLYPDDVLSVTELKTDSNGDGSYDRTWAVNEYVLGPVNAPADGRPYREIRPFRYHKAFPSHRNAVKVTGSFGYSATPPRAIKQACLLIAQRLYKRREAIFGVGSLAGGIGGLVVVQEQIKLDGDVAMLLDSVPGRSWV
jgi:hypothetical protein